MKTRKEFIKYCLIWLPLMPYLISKFKPKMHERVTMTLLGERESLKSLGIKVNNDNK